MREGDRMGVVGMESVVEGEKEGKVQEEEMGPYSYSR